MRVVEIQQQLELSRNKVAVRERVAGRIEFCINIYYMIKTEAEMVQW